MCDRTHLVEKEVTGFRDDSVKAEDGAFERWPPGVFHQVIYRYIL